MKKFIYIAIGLFATILITSCDDKREYDIPEFSTPQYTPTSEYITIADLKAWAEPKILARNAEDGQEGTTRETNAFGYLQNPADKNMLDKNGNRQILSFADAGLTGKHLRAIVIGNDESGNIYKQLYLQDETGSILVIINLTGVFAQFRVGQEVIIELDNLCIGKYYSAYQIGYPSLSKSIASNGKVNYGMNRLIPRYFYQNIHRNGKTDLEKVNKLCKTYTSLPASTESVRNTLVRFDNVSFDGGGIAQFAPMVGGQPTTGTVKMNVNGIKIDVRTSGYANFAGDIVPAGTGSITAILSQYFENLQITIRGREDLQFDK